MNFKEDFKKVIEEKKIVLFMKGTKDAPVCGFSKTVVSVLNHYGCLLYTSDAADDV